MNPLEKIYTSIEQVVVNRMSNSKLFGEYYKRSEAASPIDWTQQAQNFTAKTIQDWVNAVMAATNPDDPRRGMLMRFFNSLKLDLHLMSCVDNRILPIQCAPFKLIDKSKKENEDVHYLFERPWFFELTRIMLMHTFEGTKLIEMIKLNDKLELAEVREIPQSNFLPERGLVIKEEYDNNGVSYKSGIYANYYVQVGNDYAFGLFNEIAMIVLAKKLGLGSWMSYIEKYGVPPLFATTDRYDSTRSKELYSMMKAFRSNHFMILQGNEKIEMPKDSNTDGYQSFSNLNAFANSELSKRINGGTGISDEKSFVGAAELHERMLQYRIKVDKLIFKFYMNEEIIPRLVKLSSVYAPLANLTFEWDESETLTLKEKIAAVKDLAPYFDFDPEKLAELTGLPITDVKNVLSGGTDPNNPQKKKPSATVNTGTNLFYAPVAVHNSPLGVRGSSVFAATWDAAISRLADQIWNGEVSPSDLDKDLVLKNYASLSHAAQLSWGNDYYTNDTARQMRDNIMRFAGAKSYKTMSVLHDLKKISPDKETFIQNAKQTVNLHNETWMNTEAKFVANKASTAKDFIQFQADTDIYPNLKNRTMGDEDVRDSHAANEGVVKPVNEWTATPPYEPGCRCWLEQTTDPVTKHGLTNLSDRWASNPAIKGEVFSYKNSYNQSIEPKQRNRFENNMQAMKQYAPYNHTLTTGENKVYVNDFADASDYTANIVMAKKMAEFLGKNIYIRPHAHTTSGIKNPELGIGTPSTLADLKTYDPSVSTSVDSFLSNGFRKASKQMCKYVVCDISQANADDISQNLINRIKGSLMGNINHNIEQVIIVRGEKKAKISRKQIRNFDFSALADII